MHKFLGVALIVLAIAIAIVPFFSDCQSQGKALTATNGKTVPMKCHWTGVAEIGVAVPLLAAGALMIANRRKESLMSLSIIGIILGGLAIAFPAGLIGVCATPTMICSAAMKPLLIILGSLATAVSLGALVYSIRLKD